MQRNLILNVIICVSCGDKIESLHRHDFQTCSCGSCSVDGGLDYQKYSGKLSGALDASVYSNMPYEMIRQIAYRISRGKDGKSKSTKITFDKMSDAHLQNSIDYCLNINTQYDRFIKDIYHRVDFHLQLLLEEKLYRAENEISIPELD